MISLELAGASVALLYGLYTAFRKHTPLYYKIVFFAMASCFLGLGYCSLAQLLWPQGLQGFHVGYFGSVGMYFFLYSSYYGAINSLADDGTRRFRLYRAAAFFVAALTAVLAGTGIWVLGTGERLLSTLVLVPVVATVYFSVKHLIFPDVEMGIIAAMRPFNAMVAALCMLQAADLCLPAAGAGAWVRAVCMAVLLAACLPVARKGVQRWFM